MSKRVVFCSIAPRVSDSQEYQTVNEFSELKTQAGETEGGGIGWFEDMKKKNIESLVQLLTSTTFKSLGKENVKP